MGIFKLPQDMIPPPPPKRKKINKEEYTGNYNHKL